MPGRWPRRACSAPTPRPSPLRSPATRARPLAGPRTWPLCAFATIFIARAILVEAALSFLGLGAQPPAASWASMVASGRDYLRIAPHIALAPGIAIAITVLAFNLLGDGLRLAFDRQRNQI